jgi:Flp pilus assembly protein TadG
MNSLQWKYVMLTKTSFKRANKLERPGQAIVEFAIVLPILLVLLVGILEAGRMIFIYSVVNNASREASRYGSAVGLNDAGYHKYRYCYGIKQMVVKSAYFIDPASMTVDIRYDKGPTNTTVYPDGHGPDTPAEWNSLPQCSNFSSTAEDTNITLDDDAVQYRVLVSVSAPYSPMVNLVPLSSRTFVSSSARTILGFVNLNTGSSSVDSGADDDIVVVGSTDTPTATATPTDTPTPTPTDTPTNTPTVTPTSIFTDTPTATPGDLITFTPLPTGTATDTPTVTPTFTATNTPTDTPTFTPTFTPTNTATPVAGCDQISTSIIGMNTNSNVVSLIITNPHTAITVSSIQFSWNATNGAPGGGGSGTPLTWQYASLAGVTWSVNSGTSGYITTPPSVVTLPGNNASSTLTITLSNIYKYQVANGTTITVNFSTVGCNSITKTR